MRDNGNVIVYVDDNGKPQVDVRFQDETVWLTQAQMVDLYQSSKANVSEHIKNIFDEGELDPAATVRKFRTVQKEGNRNVTRAPHTLTNFKKHDYATHFVKLSKFDKVNYANNQSLLSHCRGDWQIALTNKTFRTAFV